MTAQVKALVVWGGGSGAAGKTATYYWPGGAGGQVVYNSTYTITPWAKTVTIGTWWASIGTTVDVNGNNGTSSVFDSITATWGLWGQFNTGSWGTTSSVINGTTTNYTWGTQTGSASGWGAGAWANGGNAPSSSQSGAGGNGYTNSISWSAVVYGWGGWGSELANPWAWGTGGWGSGATNSVNGTGWTDWLGWGGGGATSLRSTPKWGNGVVIVSYATNGSDWISPS